MLKSLLFASAFLILGFQSAFGYTIRPLQKSYDEVFGGRYIEICGTTEKEGGGPGGHAFIYIKGARLKKDTPYPIIEMYGTDKDLLDPDAGTLLSVDKSFKNVPWVATGGKGASYYGSLKPGDPLDEDVLEKIVDEVVNPESSLGRPFQNIIIHKKYLKKKPKGISYERWIAMNTIGTTYAIAAGRWGSCWKIPVNEEQTQALVNKANEINKLYIDLGSYNWNFLKDNCTHFLDRLLYEIRMRDPLKTGLLAWFQIRTPSGIMASLGKKIKIKEKTEENWKLVKKFVPTVISAYRNPDIRYSLEKFRRLPFQHGIILANLDFHKGVYKKKNSRFGLPFAERNLKKMEKNPKLKDLRYNVHHYRHFYEMVKQDLQPLEQIIRNHKKLDTPEFKAFYEIYVKWLNDSLEEVISILKDKPSELDPKHLLNMPLTDLTSSNED